MEDKGKKRKAVAEASGAPGGKAKVANSLQIHDIRATYLPQLVRENNGVLQIKRQKTRQRILMALSRATPVSGPPATLVEKENACMS